MIDGGAASSRGVEAQGIFAPVHGLTLGGDAAHRSKRTPWARGRVEP